MAIGGRVLCHGKPHDDDLALALAPSVTLAPLQYLELPVATFFGYVVFRDFPNALTLTGIAIIIFAELYVIHRERVTARHLITERAAPPI